MTLNPYSSPETIPSRVEKDVRPGYLAPAVLCILVLAALIFPGYVLAMALALGQTPFQLTLVNYNFAIISALWWSVPGAAVSLVAVFLAPATYRNGISVVAPTIVVIAFSCLYGCWVAVIASR